MKRAKLFFLILIASYTTAFSINFQFISVQDFLQENPQAHYTKCFDQTWFNFTMFPLSVNPAQQPSAGFFKETFILSIPQGRALPVTGCVITHDNKIVKNLLWKEMPHNLEFLNSVPELEGCHLQHKVVLISQPAYENYWHWTSEVLGRLALLEMFDVEYDYLLIPLAARPFMKDSLKLWGIPEHKIINLPQNPKFYVQAQELIVPSLVSTTNYNMSYFSCYAQPEIVQYIRAKLLAGAVNNRSEKKLAKRIFISRKDTPVRQIINEDEVFALLQPYGFERYQLSQLSMADQINLFHDAEIILAPQGTCLANTIFCKPETIIVELFQGLCDSTFWYLSQSLGLTYIPVPTTTFNPDYYTAWSQHTVMSLEAIEKVINTIIVPNQLNT